MSEIDKYFKDKYRENQKKVRLTPEGKEKKRIANKKYRNSPNGKKAILKYQKEYMKKRRKDPEIIKKEKDRYNNRKKIITLFKSLTKYTCLCGQIVYGMADLKTKCNKCKTNFKVVDDE